MAELENTNATKMYSARITAIETISLILFGLNASINFIITDYQKEII
jgi:hypothetical protein